MELFKPHPEQTIPVRESHQLAAALATFLLLNAADDPQRFDHVAAIPTLKTTEQEVPKHFDIPPQIFYKFISEISLVPQKVLRSDRFENQAAAKYDPTTKKVLIDETLSKSDSDRAVGELLLSLFNWNAYPEIVAAAKKSWNVGSDIRQSISLVMHTAWSEPTALSRLDAELVQMVYRVMEGGL